MTFKRHGPTTKDNQGECKCLLTPIRQPTLWLHDLCLRSPNCALRYISWKEFLKFDADFKSPSNIKIPSNFYILLCMVMSCACLRSNLRKVMSELFRKNLSILHDPKIKIVNITNSFLVFIRNRLISGGLEPVLIHTKKNYV
jgi:hypothetical protein